MSSLIRRPDSKFWIACFTARDGRQLKKSTKVPITAQAGDPRKALDLKRDALKIAQEYEAAARNERTVKQTRDVIASLHESITGSSIPQRTTREAVNAWVASKVPEVSPATARFYASSARKFLAYIGTTADRDLSHLTRDIITSYRNELARTLSRGSVNHDLGVVKAFVQDARRGGFMAENPAEFVDKIKRRDDGMVNRRPFTRAELSSILAVCSPEWKSMVMFGIYTGQRLSDIATLEWGNILPNVIELRTAKTGKNLLIPITPPLASHIASLDRSGEFIHPTLARLSVPTRSGQFAGILTKAGLRRAMPHTKSHGNGRAAKRAINEISFHSLRHTTVTMLAEAGVSAALVMEIVGHSTVAMSQHYTHIGGDVLAAGMNKLPDITL
jgi:integrase